MGYYSAVYTGEIKAELLGETTSLPIKAIYSYNPPIPGNNTDQAEDASVEIATVSYCVNGLYQGVDFLKLSADQHAALEAQILEELQQ